MRFLRKGKEVRLITDHPFSPGLDFLVDTEEFELKAQLMVEHLNKDLQNEKDNSYNYGLENGIKIGRRRRK
jgi:hypothetical protein